MKLENNHWKIPIALGMIICSLMPVTLVYLIDAIDSRSSEWAFRHQALPYLSWTFLACYKFGFVLPVLTTAVAAWFATGKRITVVRFSWVVFLLIILHIFWLSWGILAFYLANQKFVLF